MKFPSNKQFALTIVDDTDGATIESVKPVYDLLYKFGFKTTKTIWVLPPKDSFKGKSLQDYRYRQFINKLQRQGFEIALHSVSSGNFSRQDTLDGLEIFKQFIGHYPKIQINHAQNPDSLYWGVKRFTLLKLFWRWSKFQGDNKKSAYFWGDYAKKYIKYIRNFSFNNLNTLKVDSSMPYKDPSKPYANYWFSASSAPDIQSFIKITSLKNIDKLAEEGGCAIIYTHFASGFVKNGKLNHEFQKNLAYIAQQNGYFVPAGTLLDYLKSLKKQNNTSQIDIKKLELKWFWDKIIEKLFSFR
ncbi:MAG: hypothetical protein US31_C0002G0070 [Berkelbacteria bacterium GW2011_GWA1_36_9]|uniref:NodB homology domain-containing protein n=1 Tax=Berkelbacteria bacterium GW2011_GWA1_36_9 TaxID=1618331 RepID=A0A0G0FY60_9BACT|nr:MAG: hypothetical protein US31_C0002G0070 [Berkelbacteria bacterium GW2011_GWA1_36_9]